MIEHDKVLDRRDAQIEQMRAALVAIEKWWLEDGMSHFTGAPYAIFAARAALKDHPT
jgi:hypothetical protein